MGRAVGALVLGHSLPVAPSSNSFRTMPPTTNSQERENKTIKCKPDMFSDVFVPCSAHHMGTQTVEVPYWRQEQPAGRKTIQTAVGAAASQEILEAA